MRYGFCLNSDEGMEMRYDLCLESGEYSEMRYGLCLEYGEGMQNPAKRPDLGLVHFQTRTVALSRCSATAL